MTLHKMILPDIARYERDTGHMWRTAFRTKSGKLHDVIMPIDVFRKKLEKFPEKNALSDG